MICVISKRKFKPVRWIEEILKCIEGNQDGFGVFAYDGYGVLIRKTLDKQEILDYINSMPDVHVFIFHARAASAGIVDLINCHPIVYGNNILFQNGTVYGLSGLSERLSDTNLCCRLLSTLHHKDRIHLLKNAHCASFYINLKRMLLHVVNGEGYTHVYELHKLKDGSYLITKHRVDKKQYIERKTYRYIKIRILTQDVKIVEEAPRYRYYRYHGYFKPNCPYRKKPEKCKYKDYSQCPYRWDNCPYRGHYSGYHYNQSYQNQGKRWYQLWWD